MPGIDWNKGESPIGAVREYLAALEESNPDSEDLNEPPDSPTAPKNISLTDPAARWTAALGGPAFYAYSNNYLIDLRAGIIVDVEATPAHGTQEVDSTRKVARSIHESSRDVARTRATPLQYAQSRRDRKMVEMLFAYLKRILKLDRLRLRGLSAAQDKFLLAATEQYLRRMGKWLTAKQQTTSPMPA